MTDAPPELTGEEADALIATAADAGVSSSVTLSALEKLDGTFTPAGDLPNGFEPACASCGKTIEPGAQVTVRGALYHEDCRPIIDEPTTPERR